jgi:Cu2+-containing amine oxidase
LREVKNVQPAYTPEDYEVCEKIVKTDPRVLEALKKRGSKSMTLNNYIDI